MPKQKVQGEGDYEAARRYRKRQEEFLRNNDDLRHVPRAFDGPLGRSCVAILVAAPFKNLAVFQNDPITRFRRRKLTGYSQLQS